MGQSTVTPIGRAVFQHLNKPNKFGKYSLTILLPKEDPKVKEFVKWLAKAVKEEALAKAGESGLQRAMQEFQSFRDGDKTTLFKTYYAIYAGHWVLTLKRKQEFGRPTTVDRKKQPIDPSEIYDGCNVLAYIDVYGYNFGGKKSVALGVQHVMKVSDNVKFITTGIDVESAFTDLVLPEEDTTDLGANPFGASEKPAEAQKAALAPASDDPFGGM